MPKNEFTKAVLDVVRQFLVDVKREIEKEGLVATIDEAIIKVDNQIKNNEKNQG